MIHTHPVKVAIMISSLNRGGKEINILENFRLFDSQKTEGFFCVMKQGSLIEALPSNRAYANLWRFNGDFLGYFWRLNQIFRREKPQVILCLSFQMTGFYARLLGILHGIPVIYEHHGIERPAKHELSWVHRKILSRFTAKYIVLGQYARDRLIKDGIPAEKIVIISNGIDTERFQLQTKNHSGKIILGTVASIRPVKNLPLMIDAFESVYKRYSEVKLIIVGDGPSYEAVKNYIASKNLGHVVELWGQRSDIHEILPQFDIFLMSSDVEASPLTLLEAGACGIPVIATQVGEVPRMVEDGRTGLLVASKDTTQFVSAIRKLIHNENLRHQMGINARRHIETNFSLSESVQRREALIMQLANAAAKSKYS